MEPNTLEKEIREKLNKREIGPGEMAWDRLDAMLTVSEKKKPKNRAWLYIAASFLGLLLAVTLFLKQEAKTDSTIINEDENAVVAAPQNKNEQKTAIENEIALPVTTGHVRIHKPASNNAVAVQTSNIQQPENNKQPENAGTIRPTVQKQVTNMLAVSEQEIANIPPGQEAEILLMAKMDNNEGLSIKTGPVKVNPNALLNEVEGELNDNFRSKVWQTVTKNYNTVKSSVVNRNIE